MDFHEKLEKAIIGKPCRAAVAEGLELGSESGVWICVVACERDFKQMIFCLSDGGIIDEMSGDTVA